MTLTLYYKEMSTSMSAVCIMHRQLCHYLQTLRCIHYNDNVKPSDMHNNMIL